MLQKSWQLLRNIFPWILNVSIKSQYLNFIFSINLICYIVFSVIKMYCTFSTQVGHLNALPPLTTLTFEHEWRWIQWEQWSHFLHLTKMNDKQPLMAPDHHFPVHFNLNELVYTNWQLALNSRPFYRDFYDFPYKENMWLFVYVTSVRYRRQL